MASDFQIDIMKKAIEKRSLVVYDTTFNVGDFYVSLVIFKQPWFKDQPLVIGPALIHSSKAESEHLSFFQKLKSFGINIKSMGTDSEKVF